MARTKLVVETRHGTVTRVSERPYKFVVISFGQEEAFLRVRHEEAARRARDTAIRYRRDAAEWPDGKPYWPERIKSEPNQPRHSVADLLKWAADAEADAAKPFVAPTARLGVHGWSQSMAGAQKMIRDAEKYHYLNIEAVPVKFTGNYGA